MIKQQTDELKILEALRRAFGYFEDQPKVIYNSSKNGFTDPETGYFFSSTNDLLSSLHELGIKGETLKDAGIELEKTYEILSQTQETVTDLPKYEEQTTTTGFDLETKIKESEKREEQLKQTQENAKTEVERARIRTEEIIKEQQKIQEQILKSKAAEQEISKIKPLNVKVEEIEKASLSPEEEAAFKNYKKQILDTSNIQDEEERIRTLDQIKIDLAREIHSRAEDTLKAQGLEKEELDFVVTKTAEKIVGELEISETPNYLPPMAQLAIHKTVLEKVQTLPSTTINAKTKEVLLSSIGTTTKFRILPDVYLKNVTEVAFGREFGRIIFGSSYNVSETTQGNGYVFNFSQANEDGIKIQIEQNQTLETLRGLGQREAKNYIFNTAGTYFAKSSVGTKVLANKNAQVAFYSVFRGAGQTVTWTGTGAFGNLIIKSGYAPLINLATGTKFVTPVITKTATKVTGQAIGKIATQIAVKKGFSGLAAKGVALIAGLPAGPIGWVVGIFGGEALGRLIDNIGSKLKVWWTEHKEDARLFFAVGAGGLGLMIGGPIAGMAGLGIGLAATGTLGLFATGMSNLLGMIGKSMGIAVATPVTVTLLVLPLIVAFIMLVINNSAYVVPYSESSRGGAVDEECLGPVPEKPEATNIRFSSDGKYAFPTAPFEAPGYACYHWDKNKAADIFSPQNKPPMVAYESGTVVNVTLNDSLGGKYIILKGSTSGRHYYYAHLCQVFVEDGEEVKVGDVMATMDETGSGRVQHLHYAINESPLTDTFIGGDGNVCPQKDFEEKFGFGVCTIKDFCVNK